VPEGFAKCSKVASSAAKALAPVDASAKRNGVACHTIHVKDEYPAEGIIEAAKEQGCDLIVMASHGRRGLTRLSLGSQATNVVTLAPFRPRMPISAPSRPEAGWRIGMALLTVLLTSPTEALAGDAYVAQLARGYAIAETHCSVCHAIGATDESPTRANLNTPFRRLVERFPIPMLEEAARSGIISGHDEMPAFQFGPETCKRCWLTSTALRPMTCFTSSGQRSPDFFSLMQLNAK